ncbi:ATP-grasp domain-containing protein [Micromonospora echinofusca]|uniref:ATP-grasp domain-containing protein n=1 Tax=Micromonospora echinofusca TaxID=47858 RepID=A0A1C5GGW0_MICEH|nr:hypothetical protein [Micromonospora echinofusca]SCG18987.1 hypothetical protein GA0070610_5344 [Micromonospora echinofusca]
MALSGSSEQNAHPAVVLVNGAGGAELTGVHELLTDGFHTPSILLTARDLSAQAVGLDPETGTLEVAGRRVRPAVVWTRHCAPDTLTAHARPAGSVTALDAVACSRFLAQLAAAADVTVPGPAPLGTDQLRQARPLGVRTPRTLLTTDIAASARSLGAARVIVKTPDFRLVEPDPERWASHLPVVLDAATATGHPGRPVVLQEYVEHAAELRVYHLDGGLCAFQVRQPTPAARWTDPDVVTVTRVECPAAVAAAVRTLATAWGLRYAAFDLLLTSAGEVVLLEANPDGDWLFYQRRAGWTGMSFLAAVMVRQLFVEATSRGGRSDARTAT